MTVQPPSIAQRLWRALWRSALAWMIAVAAAVGWVVQEETAELLDASLQESAEMLYGVLNALPAAVWPADGQWPAPEHEEHLVWQVVDARSGLVLRSHRAPSTPLAQLQAAGFHDVASLRLYAMPLAGHSGRTLLVAQTVSERNEAEWEAILAAGGVALLIGAALFWNLSRTLQREAAEVQALSDAVRAYEPEDGPLSPTHPLATPRRLELVPVQQAVQQLGERLRSRLANERAFSVHAAHALRTPLAGLTMQLALAERLSSEAALPALRRSREAAGRMGRVVAALLALFRSGAQPQWAPIDLPALVASIPTGALQVTVVEGNEDANAHADVWQADADLLSAGLMNVLDNARAYGAAHARIECRDQGGTVRLSVHDDGPGLDPARRAQLQALLDAQEHVEPLGLGLTMANLVARAHGGRLLLEAVPTGCCVVFCLPRSPQAAAAA